MTLSRITPSTRMTLRGPVLTTLICTSFILLVVALARPQSGTQFTETEYSGRDILLALDVSQSMLAMDFKVEGQRTDRLTALKTVVSDFIKGRTGDRIGLVVFGNQVFTQCPLTRDHHVLNSFVDSLEIGMAGNGTAVGDALAISLKQLKSIESDSKVLVLVTDGKSTSNSIDPQEAARVAAKLGIKVHTIGIGGNKPALYPVKSLFGRIKLEEVEIEFDEETLKEVAAISGGTYFHADNTSGLQDVYREINKLEERNEKTFEHTEWSELFSPFAVAGLLLYLLHFILSSTVFLKVPDL